MRVRDASPGGTAFLSVFHLAPMLPPPHALARTLPAGSVVVTLLCDVGSRYLTDPFWNETHD